MACLPYPWWQGTKHTRANSPGYLLSYTWVLPHLLLGKRLLAAWQVYPWGSLLPHLFVPLLAQITTLRTNLYLV